MFNSHSQERLFKSVIPILMYHQVTPRPFATFGKYAVTPKAFARQMRWLAHTGYEPIKLDDLIARPADRITLPPRPVVITFDDGFHDCVEFAVPILLAHSFTAVFYLVAGCMGLTSRWLLSERGIDIPLMDWMTARQLVAAGFQCGSHTLSHPRLVELSDADCHEELFGSRKLLEDKLGHEVKHLAYPYGSFNERVRQIAKRSGYRSACSVQIGFSCANDDNLALPRIPVNGQDSLLDFICRLHTTQTLSALLRAKILGPWHRHGHKGAQTSR
jgi:peptidoglycan/xylan/chitin deacetylase (PgdA/CDA1 family)